MHLEASPDDGIVSRAVPLLEGLQPLEHTRLEVDLSQHIQAASTEDGRHERVALLGDP